jgi:trehalose 6-phosphate phosphatase
MTSHSQDLPSALERLPEIRRLAGERQLALFLDYDGTLTPIVERPELAVLAPEMKAVVETLARQTRVAVISGRELQDVRSLVAIDGIFYAGSHGFEIEGPGGWHLDSREVKDYLPCLDLAERRLSEELVDVPGSILERKRFTVAVHYRLVAGDLFAKVQSAVDAAMTACADLKLTHGKKVFELQPNLDWHKGKAVLWLLDALKLNPSTVLPIFLGDDITDENAFTAVETDGIGIIVRDEPRETSARYALDSTGEVQTFLTRILSAS